MQGETENLEEFIWICSMILTEIYRKSKRIRRIVGGVPADVAPYDDPMVYIRYGEKSGTVRGILDSPHYSFRGIRYAYSPTGSDRFQRPRKYYLEGDYNATEYPPPCLQPTPTTQEITGKEDCLFLNVHTPALPDGNVGLPVIMWIHGGGFRYGSASQYNPNYLLKKRIVLVTIQYRLGTLGFLSSGTSEFPGNAAIFDMAAAVEWTKKYIPFFGGNPSKIVVMGQGSGASGALLLTLSSITKNVLSGVIAMSGTAISNWAIDESPNNTAKEIAQYLGCQNDNVVRMVKCLQGVDATAIIKADSHMESSRLNSRGFLSGLAGLLSPSPATEGISDGRSLPAAIQRQPIDDLNEGKRPVIPLLTGITRDETKKAVYNKYKKEIITQLKSIPDFLDKIFVKNLQSVLGAGVVVGGGVVAGILNPTQMGSFFQLSNNTLVEALSKVSEATGDALFNLPAFLTANLWSKNNTPTYLYRFEHSGNAPKGDAFLKGLPLVNEYKNDSDSNETISHGDDLAYLFEPQNLDGSPLKEAKKPYTKEDFAVREIFTQMIADFANQGKIRVQNQFLPGFTNSVNNFVRITTDPKVSDKFRYCEMALWTDLSDRLRSVSCQFLNKAGNLKNITAVIPLINQFGEASNVLSNPFGKSKKTSVQNNALPNIFG